MAWGAEQLGDQVLEQLELLGLLIIVGVVVLDAVDEGHRHHRQLGPRVGPVGAPVVVGREEVKLRHSSGLLRARLPQPHPWSRGGRARQAALQNGPAARSRAADAHGCLIVVIRHGSTEYKLAAR
jgi:hypothetical protein